MPPKKLNIIEAVDRQITDVFDPRVVGDVNESQVKVAKFGEVFEWHSHTDEDEGFLVMRGRIAIDFRDGTVELGEGDSPKNGIKPPSSRRKSKIKSAPEALYQQKTVSTVVLEPTGFSRWSFSS